MSRRLSLATIPTNNSDVTKALCLRAFICAAVFADKGQPAMAKENYGAIIRALHREDCELRSQITWTDELCSRSEEHTSELQSLMRISYAVFCLKKKKQHTRTQTPQLQSTNKT